MKSLKKLLEDYRSSNYTCPKCGGRMFFEDDMEETLICESCNYDMSIDRYGFDSDEEYDEFYESDDSDDEDTGETELYDEVYMELSSRLED